MPIQQVLLTSLMVLRKFTFLIQEEKPICLILLMLSQIPSELHSTFNLKPITWNKRTRKLTLSLQRTTTLGYIPTLERTWELTPIFTTTTELSLMLNNKNHLLEKITLIMTFTISPPKVLSDLAKNIDITISVTSERKDVTKKSTDSLLLTL